MKRILPILQIGLGILGLAVLVLVLSGLFQSKLAETGARETPTTVAQATRKPTREDKPTPKATKKPKVDWADAKLKQVKFGKARTILTLNGQIKIWSWLPDNRRLLVELEDPESKEVITRFRIVTLDVKTGEIVDYGRRRDVGPAPVWIEKTSSIAYLWDIFPGGKPEIRLGQAGGQVQTLAEGFAGLSVQANSENIYYLLVNTKPNALRLTRASQPELAPSSPFAQLALPWGTPKIDPRGKRLVIIGRPDFHVLDLESGELQIYPVAEQQQGFELSPVWAMSGVWNPNGTDLAVTLGANMNNGRNSSGPLFSQLALFDPTSGKVQDLKLPTHWVHEYEWSPKGRFLLAKGGDPESRELYPNTFWLVDPRDAKFRQIEYFPQFSDTTASSMAWSANGRLAWVQNAPEGLGIALTKAKPGR